MKHQRIRRLEHQRGQSVGSNCLFRYRHGQTTKRGDYSNLRERKRCERVGGSMLMRKNTPKNPTCEACGRPTTLVRSEQHPKFANMLQRVFLCRCGTFTTDIVAATSRRSVLAARATTVVQGA
jgi:hypothetical protein